MSYDHWRKRLEIAKLPTVADRRAALTAAKLANMEPTAEDEGYYRIPQTEKSANGNGKNIIIGYTPVALFVDAINTKQLVGMRGDHEMTPNEVVDCWTWCCGYPISYEVYQAVAENGEAWPDLADKWQEQEGREMQRGAEIDAAERVIERDDNKPPEVLPEVAHAEAIDNAVNAARDLKIEDEASAAILLGAKNRIAELRLAADKAGHAIYDPIFADYKAKQKPWPVMVKKAGDAETALNTRYLRWREAEKQKAAAAAAEAARIQQEQDEANARAADRAIARGEPEPEPELPEVSPAVVPAPAPVTPTYRAAGQRTTPKEDEKWHFDEVTNWELLCAAVKDEPDVRLAMAKAAERMVKAGRDVPGVKRHWGLV